MKSEPTSSMSQQSNSEQVTDVSDQQKIDLLEKALELLEAKVVALEPEDELLKKTEAADLRRNLAMIIEEISINEPQNVQVLCDTFFHELLAALENNHNKLNNFYLSCEFSHQVKLKLVPLYLKRLARLGTDQATIGRVENMFKEDKKIFMSTGRGGYQGIPDTFMPKWFNDEAARSRYQTLLENAVFDPEAEKFRKGIHDKALKQLRGEEPLDDEKV